MLLILLVSKADSGASITKGYASELIKKGIDIAKNELKKNKVYLEGQVYASKLYEKLGFKII